MFDFGGFCLLLLDRKQFTIGVVVVGIVAPNHIEAVEHFTATVRVRHEDKRLMIAEQAAVVMVVTAGGTWNDNLWR